MGQFDGREESSDLFGAMSGEEPLFDQSVDVVKLGHFDENWGYGGWAGQ